MYLNLKLALASIICFLLFNTVEAQKISINKTWKFKRLESQDSLLSDNYILKNTSNWQTVNLPHTPKLEPLYVNNQWQGICWYQKELNIPKSYTNKTLILEFEAAMNMASFWINDQKIYTHYGGYLPAVFDVTAYLKTGLNTLSVKLDNRDSDITGPKPLKRLDFNTYGGLYRNNWLIVKDKVHISHANLENKTASGGLFIKTESLTKDAAAISIQTHIKNTHKNSKSVLIKHTIQYDDKTVFTVASPVLKINSGKDYTDLQKITLQNPKAWSPDTPNLYKIKTELIEDRTTLEANETHFGLRQFTFKENQLYLNGESLFLRGVNRHQEYPFIGYALSNAAQYRDAYKIKEAGFNYIRMSHYPPAPAFLDACDKLGIVVIDAILGWQYYNPSEAFVNQQLKAANQLILRDRNHPSILAWEVSLNESRMPIDFMQKMHDIVHKQYPGDNVYSCGWKPEVYDIYLEARQHRLKHKAHYPDKPYMVSEYGDWEYYAMNAGLNQHKFSKLKRIETSSRQRRGFGEKRLLQQVDNIAEAHNDNFNTPAFGDGYWVMYDYNRGYYDDHETSGLMDIFRIPKFSYYFFKSQQPQSKESVIKIASYWNQSSDTDVTVFSNTNEVALYLNDSLIARKTPEKTNQNKHLKYPPYTFKLNGFKAGTLKAIGYNNGKIVKSHTVTTPGIASKINCKIDESGLPPQAGCNDTVFLHAYITDKNDNLIPDYNALVTFDCIGDATILNVDPIYAEAGIATALIKIGENNKPVTITASSKTMKHQITFTPQ